MRQLLATQRIYLTLYKCESVTSYDADIHGSYCVLHQL